MDTIASFPVLVDFGLISILIVFSHLLRNRISFLQNTYIPSAVIAGLLALLLGHQFLDLIPFTQSNGVQNICTYPSFLVVLLFSTLFLGKHKKNISIRKTFRKAGDTFFFNLCAILGMYGFSLLFGVIFLYPFFPHLPQGFVLLLPAGFVGGHGTATAIGTVLESYGFEGALSIGYASATVGILVGILGGMVLINIAIRLGWSRLVRSIKKMPVSIKTGFVPKNDQISLGKETISPIALDSITWHIALIFAITFFAYKINNMIAAGFGLDVPVFCIALLSGAFLQKIMNIIAVGQYIDRHLTNKLTSMITDFLVAFGIASMSVKVVLSFALPLVLMFFFGTLFALAMVWYVGRRLCHNFWFERSMIMFGWTTGSVAVSMLLIRVLDPNIKSGSLEDFAISYFGVAFLDIAIISLLPHLVMQGIVAWPMCLLLGGFFLCLFLSQKLYGSFSSSATTLRIGEEEIINNNMDDEF